MLKADLCFFKNQGYVEGHVCLVWRKVGNIIHSFIHSSCIPSWNSPEEYLKESEVLFNSQLLFLKEGFHDSQMKAVHKTVIEF